MTRNLTRQLSTILDSLINFERDTNSYKSLKELSNYYLNILPKTDSILSNKNFNFSIFKDLKGQETIQGINSAVVLAASGREDYIYNPPNFNIQTDAYRLENNSVDGVSKSTNKTIENPKTIVLTKPYKLYPNPSNGLITIEFMDDEKNSNFELLEISGKLLEKKYLNNVVNELDFSKLNNGIYFLRITQSNEKQFVDKIIIAK